ncbi:hypothetical protein KP509_26G044700 [Ceratopteris richardii]|nr:hypothetical protein KP509_26G044700 [Ceratopteris richardii]
MWKAYDTLYQAPAEQRAIFDHGEPFLPPSLREKFFEMLKSFPKGVDLKDTIRLHKFNPDDEDRMTHVPQECRKLLCAYFKSVRDLGFQILETISESLGIERDYFRNVTGNNPELNVSIHRYSPYEDAEQRMGLPVHVDIDILTILLQTDDVEGLEVKKDDRWVVVKPVAGSFVINLGEVIQAITNGKYRSVLHRGMLNKDKVRSSVACFLVPTPDSMIEPIPHLVTEENPPHHLIADWATYYHHHFAKALKL